MPTFIAHVDADSFYVSAERVRNAALVGKPVAVLGNQGACVIAKSYEMKAKGVKTGEPIWEARKKCPEGVYAKRDFEWYGVLSRRMLQAVQSFSPIIEYYSVDEFFLQVELRENQLDRFAADIRDAVYDQVRVPVTVGIARTRTLAKLVSDTAKPNGAKAIPDRAAEEKMLGRFAVTEVCGIGEKRAARVAPYGVRTALDFIRADGRLVREKLTIVGYELWTELRGERVVPLRRFRAGKQSISRGGSVKGTVVCPMLLWAWAVRNLERLIEELHYEGVVAGKLAVYLVYKAGQALCGEGPLDAPSDRFDLLLDAVRVAVRRAWLPGAPITHVHVVADQLRRERGRQLCLFTQPSPKLEAVARVKREVNARIGRFAVRSGATLPLSRLYQDPAENFDVPDIKGKHCF